MQVGRDKEVDCALAELYVRGQATQRMVNEQHRAEVFSSIYARMNEVRKRNARCAATLMQASRSCSFLCLNMAARICWPALFEGFLCCVV